MNITGIHDCFGCGVCATACPRNIIDIKLNSSGFYEPQIINLDKCTNCGICYDVCSFCHGDISLTPDFVQTYAGWSNNSNIRRICSSGGIGYEVGKKLISQGFKVCGVLYNSEKERAEHYIATSVEELIPSIGSKYIQSYTVDGFKAINRKEKYLVVGTPCQIDSFRRYIKKFRCEDNFVLLDFFCHGVPSMLMWYKYLDEVTKKTGKINYVSWRNKFAGWHDSWAMSINGEKEPLQIISWKDSYNMLIKEKKGVYNSRYSQGDSFYKLFLGNLCLGKQCYHSCRFKYDNSSADIRIGDCWGKTYKDNDEGVSSILVLTKKGNEVMHNSNCYLKELPLSVIAEGQMKSNPLKPYFSYIVQYCLKSDRVPLSLLTYIATLQFSLNKFRRRLFNPRRTLSKLINKIIQ